MPEIHGSSLRLVKLDPQGRPIHGTGVEIAGVTGIHFESDADDFEDATGVYFDLYNRLFPDPDTTGGIVSESQAWEEEAFHWRAHMYLAPVVNSDLKLVGWVKVLPGGPEMRAHP